MDRHIVVPMGRSEASKNALRYALREYPHGHISVLHITEPCDPYNITGNRDPEEYMIADCDIEFDDKLVPDGSLHSRCQRKRSERVFEQACTIAKEYGREITPVVRSGGAIEEIIAYVTDQDVDHVVIGDHPQTKLRPVFKSVPTGVAEQVEQPVTIIS